MMVQNFRSLTIMSITVALIIPKKVLQYGGLKKRFSKNTSL